MWRHENRNMYKQSAIVARCARYQFFSWLAPLELAPPSSFILLTITYLLTHPALNKRQVPTHFPPRRKNTYKYIRRLQNTYNLHYKIVFMIQSFYSSARAKGERAVQQMNTPPHSPPPQDVTTPTTTPTTESERDDDEEEDEEDDESEDDDDESEDDDDEESEDDDDESEDDDEESGECKGGGGEESGESKQSGDKEEDKVGGKDGGKDGGKVGGGERSSGEDRGEDRARFVVSERALHELKQEIESLSKEHQVQIMHLLSSDSATKLNSNKNGVFVNLTLLSPTILRQLYDFAHYTKEQEYLLSVDELQKQHYHHEFFVASERALASTPSSSSSSSEASHIEYAR